MALDAFRCRTSAGSQGGPRTGEGGGGTELSEGIDVGGSSAGDDPTPLEYLRDSRYGSYDVELTVDIRPSPSSRAASTTVCQTNLSNLYWTPAQQLAHHSVTGCAMRPGDLLASGTISGRGRESFGSLLELSWKGTRPVELGDGSSRTFLEDGDEVIMRGWCEARSGLVGRVGFGECSARVLPADPYPYESAGPICDNTIGSSEIRYEDLKVRSSSGSTSLLRVRVALAAKRLEDVEELPQEDGRGGGDQPSEIVLTFRDAQSSEAHRIEGSLAIIEFLDVWNQGGRLIPTEPVTRARMREVVFLLDSIDADVTALANDNVPASSPAIVGRIKSRLATVEGTLTGLRGDASFAIGTFGPTLADVCLLPTLVGVRGRQGLGIDLASYPTLMKVEDACRCHPWFCTTGP
ncbi:hypothetical protein THAOC_17055 [Thalassiosira oceanica]|uniref:Fumarylacetoacetase n=1 Tax=Thalassiosira oceanica TaxID=159749 RepID=K0SVS4_THAOC|nr:hypothetical protein THAOC_17055 [Thalassiosira oceanica]|eukprot:EJK62337.1 hypothetical protein THAOC_17055 [Thalassiosira oceanica]